MAQRKKPARGKVPAPGTVEAIREPIVTRTDILVKATRIGYYNLIRFREGDTFYLNDEEDFSKRWMVAVDANREEIPEETDRLSRIADAARRKAVAERASERARFADEVDPVEAAKKAEADLEKARKEKPTRGATKPSGIQGGGEPDVKRKIPGTDYERHEDAKPTDAQGPEPQGGRASDKNVV